MVRLAIQVLLTILGNACGLLIAAIVLHDFRVSVFGFAVSVIFFTIAQVILAPFVLKLSIKYAPAFRGGIALVTTLVSLLLTSIFTDSISLNGITTWIAAPLIVWLGSVVAGILLPLVLFKKVLAQRDTGK
ncbi:MAG: hypothetical protein WBP12_01975 [Candidatus Saccharimonas sp.]